MPDPDAFTIDIQRALQEAAIDTDDALRPVKKKGKKRAREHQKDAEQASEVQVKTKQRKKNRTEDAASEAARGALIEVAADSVLVDAASDRTGKKKSKTGKGKQRAQLAQEDVQVASVPVAQAAPEDDLASEDFLSAVVAAASATSHLHAGPSSEFAHQMPPYSESMLQYQSATGEFASFGGSPPMFHSPTEGVELPDLSLVSSEYLLQTLQNLDISQITSVLKSLGDNGVSFPSVNITPSFVPLPQPPGPPPVKQTSAKSVAILGRHPKQVKASGQSTRSLPPPALPHLTISPDEENPDHAHMLANVWMNASKLAQMVKTHGLVYKKGKFSATEEAQLTAAIERFKAAKGFGHDDLVDLIFSKEKGRGEAFWQEITSALHLRPIIAVYHHVRRKYHPLGNLGKWMASEDASLKTAVIEFGQQWQKVSERVGRSASDCRDRYRNHLENSAERRTGSWSKEEEDELTTIVSELKMKRDEVSDNDIFWGIVSQRMGGRRGRQQCRIKWLDSLSSRYKNDGTKPRWSQLDAYILVHKVDSLNVRDDSEIDWKTLPDEDWSMWSAHALQRRWLTMKRSVKGYEDMSHAELMDILRTKKAQSPPPPAPSRGSKKNPRSAEIIEDSEDDDDAEGDASEGDGQEDDETGPSSSRTT